MEERRKESRKGESRAKPSRGGGDIDLRTRMASVSERVGYQVGMHRWMDGLMDFTDQNVKVVHGSRSDA